MATKRVDRLIERANMFLKSQKKDILITEGLYELLAYGLNEAQVELCRKYRALPHRTTMLTEEDQALYGVPFPIAAIGSIVPPSTSELTELTVVDNQREWTRIKKEQTGLTEPTYVFLFGDELEFHPAPSDTGDEYTIYAYRYPERIVERGYDPEVGPEWDRALYFGILRDFVPELEQRFQQEAAEVGHSRMVRMRMMPPKVGTRATDELGF